MTNALEDLVTSLQIFSDILEREGVDIEDFDYVEFLTDTVPSLGERIEDETLGLAARWASEAGNIYELRETFEDMGVLPDGE